MSKEGRLVWRGYLVEWKHSTFRTKKDLTLHPHFSLKAIDESKDVGITYPDVVMPAKLRHIDDFTRLPEGTQRECLNQLIDTVEKEAKRVKK